MTILVNGREPRSGIDGFTLIEVLVATTLFVFVLTTMYAAFNGVFAANGRVEAAIEESQTVRVVFSDLAAQLACVTQVRMPTASLTKPAAGNGPPVRLQKEDNGRVSLSFTACFAGSDSSDRSTTGISRVRYMLESSGSMNDNGGIRYSLVREQAPIGPVDSSAPNERSVLIKDRVRSLEFQFLESESGTWQPSRSGAQRTPAGVSIALTLWDKTRKSTTSRRYSAVVPLPVTRALSDLPESRAPVPIGASQTDKPNPVDAKNAPEVSENKSPAAIKPKDLPDAGLIDPEKVILSRPHVLAKTLHKERWL